MGGAGLRDDERNLIEHAEALENYLTEVLPAHTFVNARNRVWSWSTPGGFWAIQHSSTQVVGVRYPKWSLTTTGPDVSLSVPDDDAGLGITMAVLRCLGAIDRGDDAEPESRRELIGHLVERCRAKYWEDGQTDAEFVAGVVAQLDIDGWLVEPHQAAAGGWCAPIVAADDGRPIVAAPGCEAFVEHLEAQQREQ